MARLVRYALAPLALSLAALTPASAQFFWGPPAPFWAGPDIDDEPVPAGVVARVLRASGYRLVERPRVRGDRIVAIGARPDGRRAQFVIDAYDGALIRTTLLSEPRPKPPAARVRPPATAAPPVAGVQPQPAPPKPPLTAPQKPPAPVAPPPAPQRMAPATTPPASAAVAPDPATPAAPADIGPTVKPVAPQAAPPKVELPAIPPAPPFVARPDEPNGAP